MICPTLNVVSMNRARSAALLTGVSIASEHGSAPRLEVGAESGALALQRAPVFVGVARSAATGARPRAEGLCPLIGLKGTAARRTGTRVGLMPLRPARLGAELGGRRAVSLHAKRLTADGASEGDLSVLHSQNLAQRANESKYVAVALERMAAMGLEPRLVD